MFTVNFLNHSKDWDDQKVKTAIKKLLEYYSQTHLERMLCPFSQVINIQYYYEFQSMYV